MSCYLLFPHCWLLLDVCLYCLLNTNSHSYLLTDISVNNLRQQSAYICILSEVKLLVPNVHYRCIVLPILPVMNGISIFTQADSLLEYIVMKCSYMCIDYTWLTTIATYCSLSYSKHCVVMVVMLLSTQKTAYASFFFLHWQHY